MRWFVDKTQIINAILESRNFSIPKRLKTRKVDILLVLPDGVSPEQISPIKNINFVFIGGKEVNKLLETGGGIYYVFGKFEVKDLVIKIGFTKAGIGNGGGSASVVNFECWKYKDEWKVKGQNGAISHYYL